MLPTHQVVAEIRVCLVRVLLLQPVPQHDGDDYPGVGAGVAQPVLGHDEALLRGGGAADHLGDDWLGSDCGFW